MMAESKDPNLVQLDRFIYLGDENKVYPESVQFPFNTEKVKSIIEAVTTTEAAGEILHAYRKGNYLNIETVVYALALCAHSAGKQLNSDVFEAASEVCSSASSMFSFTYFYNQLAKSQTTRPSTGFGRAHRRFLSNWYNGKDASTLAAEVTKVKSRHKWTHKDVLCMSHVKGIMPGNAAVLKYLMKGIECAEKDYGHLPEVQPVLKFLKGVQELSHTTDPETAARLIELHDLCLEHVPPSLLKSNEVSLCLIPRIPVGKLLQLLPFLIRHGLLRPDSAHFKAVLERLTSEDILSGGIVDPLETFLAIRRWQTANKIVPRPKLLDDALHNLHEASFQTVASKEKRYLIALDVDFLKMNVLRCIGCNLLTPSHVGDIVLMSLVRAELSNATVVAFSTPELVSVDIDNKMSLVDIVENFSKIKHGPVQLSAPILWALQKKNCYDLFLVVTSGLNPSSEDDYGAALKEYKETLHLPDTRYILCTLRDQKSSFLTDKPDMLNIIGFNIHLLKIIQDFSCGEF